MRECLRGPENVSPARQGEVKIRITVSKPRTSGVSRDAGRERAILAVARIGAAKFQGGSRRRVRFARCGRALSFEHAMRMLDLRAIGPRALRARDLILPPRLPAATTQGETMS